MDSQRQAATEELRIYEAVLVGVDRREEVIGAIWDTTTEEEAVERLQRLLRLDAVQARAILDMQVHRLTAAYRERVATEIRRRRDVLRGPDLPQ